MIDITNDVVKIAKEVFSEVFRAYPQKLNRGKSYAVINPSSHMSELSDENGEEITARINFTVSVFGKTPVECDASMIALTDKFNKLHMQCIGQSPSYQYDNNTYYVQVVYSVLVDRRGFTYR